MILHSMTLHMADCALSRFPTTKRSSHTDFN